MSNLFKQNLSRYWIYRLIKLNALFFFKLRKNLKIQLAHNKSQDKICKENGLKVIIPLLETSHYQMFQVLALAKAFEFRGAEVKVLICDSFLPGCEIKSSRSPRIDPCLSCRLNRKNALKYFNLNLVYLSDFIEQPVIEELNLKAKVNSKSHFENYIIENIDIGPAVNDSIVRFFYGAVPHQNSDQLSNVRRDHLITAMISLHVAKVIHETWNPDIVFNNMSVYSSWDPFYKYFESVNIKTNLVSISQFNYNAITINSLDLYKSNSRYNDWLKARNYNYLKDSEEAVLNTFINTRFSGESKIFKESAFFDPLESVSNHIDIDNSKKNIFLFSNIYWDVGMSDSSTLFSGVIEWVLDSIRYVEGNDSCHLYIKPHPGEVYDGSSSLKGIRDFINESFPELPENVTIIHPESKLKTYDLFPFIDIGLVYNGTLGLEMMLHNIPVIVCGLSPYGFLNSATVPDSIQSYKLVLANKISPSKIQSDEVRLFSYFYFIKTMIPWTLTKSAYADNFESFAFNSINDLKEGNDQYLDHICNSILKSDSTTVESW